MKNVKLIRALYRRFLYSVRLHLLATGKAGRRPMRLLIVRIDFAENHCGKIGGEYAD